MAKLKNDAIEVLCEQFINRLKEIKEEKNITTAQLSILTHIPQPNITHMETMKAKPNLRTLVKICHALDIHLDLKERK